MKNFLVVMVAAIVSVSALASTARKGSLGNNALIVTNEDDTAALAALGTHAANKSNPHGVTAAQVGAVPSTGGTFSGSVTVSSGSLVASDTLRAYNANIQRLTCLTNLITSYLWITNTSGFRFNNFILAAPSSSGQILVDSMLPSSLANLGYTTNVITYTTDSSPFTAAIILGGDRICYYPKPIHFLSSDTAWPITIKQDGNDMAIFGQKAFFTKYRNEDSGYVSFSKRHYYDLLNLEMGSFAMASASSYGSSPLSITNRFELTPDHLNVSYNGFSSSKLLFDLVTKDEVPASPTGFVSVASFSYSVNALDLTLANGAALTASTNDWPDGQSVFAVVRPAGSFTYDTNTFTVVGYGYLPTNTFQTVVWRVGTKFYINPLTED